MSPICHPDLSETLNCSSVSVSPQADLTGALNTHDKWRFLSTCSGDKQMANRPMSGVKGSIPYLCIFLMLHSWNRDSTMRTGARIMEDRVSPSSLTASLSKQQRNFGRINFQDKSQDVGENGEAGLAGGGLQGTRVTLSVMRRVRWGLKCALPEVLQPRQNPERKLLFHLALIRSNVPWRIQENPPKINEKCEVSCHCSVGSLQWWQSGIFMHHTENYIHETTAIFTLLYMVKSMWTPLYLLWFGKC